ncbi:type II toxin-antitoxin system RelE family toxin [Kribbella sp. ALI-6-A]|uniref:type II toxin-antitoxin system RelE family toxin n=1 Tax=Kribbella sp. ALI-6-A TaxID=1933817 RepID=UPI00117B525D|nr:hypothetical protein [Kribbella sp. ALI-6-A]
MTYRVEFHATALAQLDGLPTEAFDALVRRATELVSAPWDSLPLSPEEPAFRQTTFHPLGLLSFYLDADRELIRIFDVTWVG